MPSVSVGEALSRVESSIDDPGLHAYFDFHRRRFLFTLDLVAAIAAGTDFRVLDVGHYPGHLAAALECLGYQVTGVTAPGIPCELPNVHLVDIEEEPLPFSNESFDLIVFVETIEHLPHSPVFPLREMLRVAKPGAAIIVTTPNLVCGSNRLRFMRGRSPLFPLEDYFQKKGTGAPCNIAITASTPSTSSTPYSMNAGGAWCNGASSSPTPNGPGTGQSGRPPRGPGRP